MNEESLFHEALARPTPEERAAFLDAACAGRPELRAAVESLLAAHEQSGEFLCAPSVAAARWPEESVPDTAPGEDRGAATAANETAELAGSTDADSASAPPLLSDGGLPRTAPESAAPVAPAADLPDAVGRYEIRRLLGRGGMGVVYLAHDPELDRLVALKVPKLAGPDAEERFLREARAAAALSHPNLCPVYDVGRADGVPYLAMAYVPGPNLTEMLRQDGPPSVARCAAIAAGVARGMAEAHRHGIIHRDLKPGNVLLDRKGEPVVTDFGLALRASPAQSPADPAATLDHNPRLTQSGVLMGTPAYMPPEQARGELDRIGPASDVYALGAILYELLTGRPPFPATPLRDMVRLIETEPAPVPSKVRAKVPPGLDAVCRRAMAKDPARRIASMEAFADALAPFAAPRKRRRWGRVAVAAAAFALLLAVAGAVFYAKTDYGTVEVHLSDPKADVQVSVDGNDISLTEGGRVTKLRAGPHGLLVKGEGFETESKDFKITRGSTTVVRVELRPNAAAATKTGQPPSDPERARLAGLLVRGAKLIQEGQLGEVDSVIADALKIDPESPGALALRAHARAARNDFDGARADAEAALKLNPETPRALVIRGYVNMREGKPADSIADTTAALRIDPKCWPAWSTRAKAFFDRGDYRQTIADATRAIGLDAKRPEAYVNRAVAYAMLGEYGKALADFTDAAGRAPSDPGIWVQRSALYIKMGDPEKAAADWQKAKALDPALRLESRPTFPDPPKPPERKKLTADEAKDLARALAAFNRAWSGDWESCRKAAEEACRIDPTSPAARSAQARIWVQFGRWDDAIAEATEALRLDPDDAWAYSARAAARMSRNEPAGAAADATVALRLDAANAATWNTRGWAYLRRAQYHQAVADLTEANRLAPGFPLPYANRGQCHLCLGDYRKALAEFEEAAKLQPTNSQWRMICSVIRARLRDAEGARKDRELAIKLDPRVADQPDPTLPNPVPPAKKDPELPEDAADEGTRPPIDRARLAALLADGRRLVDAGRFDQVEAVAAEALKIDPESPRALALRAVFRQTAGNDAAGARADAEAALKLNPETFYALVVRAELNGQQGRFDDVIADATVAHRLRPKHPAPLTRRARAYLEQREPRQAVSDASLAIKLGYEPADVFLTRAGAYVFLGEYENALKDLDGAAARAPSDPRVFIQRSVLQAKLGHADLAAADWKKAKELAPDLPERARPVIPDPPKPPQRKKLSPEDADALAAALRAGEKALTEQRLADARKAIDQALRLDPTSADAHALRGRLLGHTEQYAQAFAAANEAIRLDPGNAWAYTVRGGARDPKKDPAGAIADHTIAIGLNPGLYQAWSNRAHAYNCRGQYRQAVADSTEALRLRPGDWVALRNRGGSHLFLGEYKEALADYVQVAGLQPTNGRWLLICAAIRTKLGNPDGAAKDREQALKIDPQLANGPPITLPPVSPPAKQDPEPPADR